jgi:nucleoside triphosphate pyrophosphatase
MSRLLLASTSPRRIRLLREAGFNPEVLPSQIEETQADFLTPAERALFNAIRKGMAIAIQHPDDIVLSADTIVTLDGSVFGKPADLEEAFQMLKLLVGKTHEVITAVAVMHLNKKRTRVGTERTAVKFRSLADSAIREYLEIAEPLDKAGAYAAQESPDLIIESVTGSFTNVVGLPMELTIPILAEFGIRPETP